MDKLQEELDLLHKDLIARFPVEKGSVEEAKQAVFKRPVQSTGNPIKLVVQEENNVMNIEIIAQDGSLDGVWIGALTLELLPDSATSKDNMKQLQSVFNKSAMIKYGISLEDIDLITAQSLGATVFSTKAHDLPGSYFMRHEKVRQMLNPKQQGYFDDIPFFAGDYEISEEEEAALDAHLEQLKKKKRPKVKEEFKPVDVELGDIFKDETVEKEGPVDRGDAGEEVDVDETVEEAKAAAKEKKRQRAA